jgi:hypothetical protein
MNKVLIPEQRSYSDYFGNNNFYTKKLSNRVTEYYSKEFYNSNFTRKFDDLENVKKEILLFLIKNSLE